MSLSKLNFSPAVIASVCVPVAAGAIYLAAFKCRGGSKPSRQDAAPTGSKSAKKGQQSGSGVSSEPIEDWTPHDVAMWIVSIGITPAEATLFETEGVDGQVLARMQDRHLKELGIVKLGHRMRIVEQRNVRLDAERASGNSVDDEAGDEVAPVVPNPHVQQTKGATRSSAAPPQAPAAASAQDEESTEEAVVFVTEGIRNVFTVLSSPQFAQADPSKKRQILAQVQATVPQIVNRFGALPAQHQQLLQPVVRQLLDVVGRVQQAIGAPSAAGATHADASAEAKEDEEEVTEEASSEKPHKDQEVAAVLLRFKEILTSDIIQRAPQEKRDDLLATMIRELGNVKTHTIPSCRPETRNDLNQITDGLIHLARSLSSAGQQQSAVGQRPTAAAQRAAAAAPQHASMEFIITRLRAIFDSIKSSQLIEEKDLEVRADRVAVMRRDVEGLVKEAAHLKPEERQVVDKVAENILALLGKLEAVTQMQTRIEQQETLEKQRGAAQQPRAAPPTAQRPVAAPGRSPLSLQGIATQLRSVVGVLRSDDFRGLAPARKAEVVAMLNQKIDDLEAGVSDDLSDEERAAAVDSINNVRNIVAAMGRSGQPAVAAAAPTAASTSAAPAGPPSESLGLILGQLKDIQAVLDAPAFATSTKKQQLDLIGAMQQHLAKLIPVMQRLPRADVSAAIAAARELSDRLQTVGQSVVDELARSGHTGEDDNDDAQEDAADEEAEEAEDEEPTAGESVGESKLAQQVAAKLDSIDRAIVSPTFKKATLESKYAFIEGIHEALVKLVEIIESLPPADQRKAMARIAGTHDKVRDIVANLSTEINEAENAAIAAVNAQRDQERADDAASHGHTEASMKVTMGILDKLQKLFAVLNSDVLKNSDPEQRMSVCAGVQRELVSLVDQTKQLTAEQRHTLLPLIQRAAETVSSLMSADEDAANADEAAKDGEDDEDDAENDEQEDDNDGAQEAAAESNPSRREAIFTTATELADVLESRADVSPDMLRMGIALLREMDRAVPRSTKEKQAQTRLEEALKKRLSGMKGAADEEDSSAAAANPPAADEFTNKVRSLTMELQNARIESTADLTAYMERLSKILETPGNWRQNETKVLLVKRLLNVLEERRAELEAGEREKLSRQSKAKGADAEDDEEDEDDDDEEEEEESGEEDDSKKSALVRALEDARSKVTPDIFREKTPSGQGVAIFKLLEVCIQNRAKLSPAELRAAEQLRQALSAAKDAAAQSAAGSKTASPSKGAAAASAQSESADGEAATLLHSLRTMDKPTNVGDLSPLIKEFGRLRNANLSPRGQMALDEAQTILERHLRQIKNDVNSMGKSESPAQQSPAKAAASSSVVNPLAADVDLLPRIAERLKSEDFVAHCSAFEIQCISAILARLSDAAVVHRTPELNRAVKSAVQLFSRRVAGLDESKMKRASDVMTPLELTAMVSESHSGVPILRYVFVSPEETQDGFEVDAQLLRSLAAQWHATPIPSAEDVVAAVGRSEALLVTVSKYPDGSTNKTAVSEINLVAQLLDELHGFSITRLNDDVSSSVVATKLREIAARKPKRLLVFVQTPIAQSVAAPPYHQVLFENGSSVSHEEVLRLVKDQVEHAVLVHDSGTGLDCIASYKGTISRHVGVSLTQAAFLVANTSRCWLYDGFATPIIAEMLGSQNAAVLCPEDFVNCALSALGATAHGRFGPHTQDEALGRPFLFNASADDAEDFEDDPSSPLESSPAN